MKQWKENNNISLKNIEARSVQLAEQNETKIAEYKEISNSIAPEDITTVREERRNIRNSNEKSLWKRPQERYGRKYQHELMQSAESDIEQIALDI